jgi:hypothetical protein
MRGVVLFDYWVAGRLGRIWLAVRGPGRVRTAKRDLPEACLRLAGGEPLSAALLLQAQEYAMWMWWRMGLAALLLVFPVILAVAAAQHVQVAVDALLGAGIAEGFVMMAALSVGGLIAFRCGRTRDYVRANPGAVGEPLPKGELGLPSRADFWVMTVIGVVVFAALLYAAFSSSRG